MQDELRTVRIRDRLVALDPNPSSTGLKPNHVMNMAGFDPARWAHLSELKYGLDRKQMRLQENFQFGITDPTFKDPRINPDEARWEILHYNRRHPSGRPITNVHIFAPQTEEMHSCELALGFYIGPTCRN